METERVKKGKTCKAVRAGILQFYFKQLMLTSVLKIRNTLLSAIDDYFKSADCCEVPPPILTPLSCEVACVGGSDLISVNYYGQKAYLSQSGQLYLEALALQLERVYCVAPTFRAESTLLSTHLDEFWMCEAEMINIDFDRLIQTVNDLLCTIIIKILNKHSSELTALGSDITALENITTKGFQKITYSHAIDILRGEHVSINWGDDIQPHHELILSKHVGNSPLIITLYPKALSSFYKAICPNNPNVTLSFDVVAPYGFRELVGGSLREVDEVKLRGSLQCAGVDLHPYEWYIKMISMNPTPHGGFGLGIERMLSWICNLRTIQDALPFPRAKDNLWTEQQMYSFSNNTNSDINISKSNIWDDIVFCFGATDQEQNPSRSKQNFDAILPMLNCIINSYQLNIGEVKPRALDFGCGTGLLAEHLNQIGFAVSACDTSSEMIKQARASSCGNVLYETNGIDFVLRQSPFRLITVVMVFQFVSDMESLIAALQAKLEDNGLLFFAVHHVEYVTECIRLGVKFRGFSDDTFPSTGEIQIGSRWIPTYVRSPEWYDKIFVAKGMTQVGYSLSTTSIDVPQIAQSQWRGSKYYMAWYKKEQNIK